MKLGSEFQELLRLFEECGVKYLVVGAHALAFYGFPRNTKDLDIFHEPSPENADRILKALDLFGFGSLGMSRSDFSEPGLVIQLGYPPNRVDLISQISGVEFGEAWENRQHMTLDGVAVPFISLEDFVRNKRASGRLSDLADLERLGYSGPNLS